MVRNIAFPCLFAGLFAFSGLGCGKNSQACDDSLSSLRLGVIIPISGVVQVGELWQTAARQAANDINAAGGVNKSCIELVVRDTQSDPAEAVKQASELMEARDVSAFLFQQSTDVAGMLLQVYYSNDIPWPRVPIFCAGCTAPDFDGLPLPELEGAPLLWRMTANNTEQGAVLAALAHERGLEKAGYYAVGNAFGTGLANRFVQKFEELEGTSHEDWQQAHPEAGTVNVSEDLGQIYNSGAGAPDVIVINSLPNLNVAALQSWESDYGAQGRVFLTFTSFGLDIATAAGLSAANRDSIEGVAYSVGAGLRGDEFRKDYGALTGEDLPVQFADGYYDAVFAYALAALASGDEKPGATGIQRGLQLINAPEGEVIGYGDFAKAAEILAGGGSINFQGVSGDLDWDLENNNAVESTIWRWRIEDGSLVIEDL